MMKTIAATLVVLAISGAVVGSPVLVWEKVHYENSMGGLPHGDQWVVSVSDDQSASWAVNIDFWGCCGGPIVQLQAWGVVDVDVESMARAFGGEAWPYRDSWVYDEWDELVEGISGLPNAPFHIHVGTSGGEAYGPLHLAYLFIEEGGCICWDGTIARQGVEYPTSGSIPEPMTGLVLAFGLLAIRRRGWRSRVFPF
jgi:hypothetical protein